MSVFYLLLFKNKSGDRKLLFWRFATERVGEGSFRGTGDVMKVTSPKIEKSIARKSEAFLFLFVLLLAKGTEPFSEG